MPTCKNCGFSTNPDEDLDIFLEHNCYADEKPVEEFDAKAHYGEPPE